jgi:hypothetical protein
MHQSTEDNWCAIKRILHYVAGTLHYGIQIHRALNLQMHAYSDADLTCSIDDRCTT